MKNIVKNELIVQHDTIICDPFLGRVYHQTKYGINCGGDQSSKCF